MKMRNAVAATLLALGVFPAHAIDVCDAGTTTGTWVARCDGELTAPGGLALTRLLGTCSASRQGYWTCTANVNLGGVRVAQALQGHATNNGDCTGFISYQQTFNGQPGPQLDIDYVILNDGDEIWGLPRPGQAGDVTACTLKRMSKGQLR